MEKQIKLLTTVSDSKTGQMLNRDSLQDLGKERNEKAVKNGLAVWVDSRSFKEVKNLSEKVTEKKEETPKKTTSLVKGKKIETK